MRIVTAPATTIYYRLDDLAQLLSQSRVIRADGLSMDGSTRAIGLLMEHKRERWRFIVGLRPIEELGGMYPVTMRTTTKKKLNEVKL